MFQFPGFAFNLLFYSEVSYLLLITRNPKPSRNEPNRFGFSHFWSNTKTRRLSTRGLGVLAIEGGFPHSEIRGSKLVRSSPRLIAAYHVLHRLSAPRHPPDTLKALDRSHYRCPPLGSGSSTCVLMASIEKTSLLQTHPGAPRSSRAHCDWCSILVRTNR